MKEAELIEGPEAFKRFDALMGAVVKVPRSVVQARVEEARGRAAKNPNVAARNRNHNVSARVSPSGFVVLRG